MHGEIYKITNKASNKCYIGQAQKYTGKFDNKWGTKERWKSHIREAYSGKDHCTLLNNAINPQGVPKGPFVLVSLSRLAGPACTLVLIILVSLGLIWASGAQLNLLLVLNPIKTKEPLGLGAHLRECI